ncbi:MAG: hypothetical protein VX951_11400 [Planctomycetota bacterium]|nr:hypothetical protein [Planctomycetota bacterium]
MKKVIPYKHYDGALKALDNGGRFYNLFTKARDEEVSPAELAKVAGVFSDRQKMFLFLEMAVHDLEEANKQSLYGNLSTSLRAEHAEHRPQALLPSEADERGVAAKTAIITGYPRFVTDKTVFSGFIMVPIMAGKTMTFMMIPITDCYDVYELSDEVSSKKTFIANVRGLPRLPAVLSRFGGILKETSRDEKGEQKDRLFLEGIYYTPLEGLSPQTGD